MAHNSGKIRGNNNEDRVLRTAVIAVIILFVAGAIVVAVRSLNLRPDTTKGIEKLEEMDNTDLGMIEAEIASLEDVEAAVLKQRNSRSNSEKFKDTVILGDFLAQGLYEQEVLDESFILAEADSCVHNFNSTAVADNLDSAVEMNPKVIFLELGVNDAAIEGGNADTFEQEYTAFLEQVKSKLPNAKIYINNIIPVTPQAIEENPGLANIEEYNKRLKTICRRQGITFIDNSNLVKDDYYRGDGKHMTKDYYTLWAERMVEVAAL